MRWANRYLSDDESIVLELRKHPIALARPALAFLAVSLLGLAAGFLLTPEGGTDLVDGVAAVAAGLFLVRLLWRYLGWRSDLVVVSDERILRSQGVLARSIGSMPLGAITDLTCRRPLVGRLLGYGDLLVETAGRSDGVQRIDRLRRPEEVYRELSRLLAARARAPRNEAGPFERRDTDTPVPGWDDPAVIWDEVDDHGAWKTAEHDDTGPLPRVVV
ncbi:MAG: PH domain-containing protein [Actinomycetota bacterium]|nr:PH domain-containing protein [Actinomycetota bacterium]